MEKITSPKQIKSEGTQIFNVPNTPEGVAFVQQASKYLNRSCFERLGKKGRGPNRPKTMGGDLSVKDAVWFAIYAYKTHAQYHKESEARMKDIFLWTAAEAKKVRNTIALEQLSGKAILPETIEIIRQQIRDAEMPKIKAQTMAECKAKITAELEKLWEI